MPGVAAVDDVVKNVVGGAEFGRGDGPRLAVTGGIVGVAFTHVLILKYFTMDSVLRYTFWWRVVLFVSLQRIMLFKSAHPDIDCK